MTKTNGDWSLVGFVESKSKPDRVHTVKFNSRHLVWGCDCQAWIYQRLPLEERKACRHIRAVASGRYWKPEAAR